MKLKHVFSSLILLRCVFLAAPATIISPFPFAKGSMTSLPACSYAWSLCEAVSILAICLVFYLMVAGKVAITKDRVNVIGAYMLMGALDLVDYILRGNSEWFMQGDYPITNNVIIFILFNFLTWNLEESRKHDVVKAE